MLNRVNEDALGLLVGNEEYSGTYSPRNYTGRDLLLMETYLNNALGYPVDQIYRLTNINNRQPVDSVLALIRQKTTSNSDIFVYLSGYGMVREEDDTYNPQLVLNSEGQANSLVNLIDLYRALAALPSEKMVIINNIDFSRSFLHLSKNSNLPLQAFRQSLYNTAITLSSEHEGLAFMFSSELDQANHLYLGNGNQDKKHHIFPYFLAKGLQQRHTTSGDLFQYLQRNVSYTARKLHNEPEDPGALR
ncbi:MAG: caspase family protein [Balneolaceae bacterium]|nr:caspase family protein [Balneolaceae bacterium]